MTLKQICYDFMSVENAVKSIYLCVYVKKKDFVIKYKKKKYPDSP